MDVKLIRKLAELMNAEGLKNIEITDGQLGIKIERDTNMHVIDETKVSVVQNNSPSLPERILLSRPSKPASSRVEAKTEPVPKNVPQIFEIRSPVVGKFMASYDNNPIYVTIGSRVEKGDVLCVIEAGRHFNEITSDVDGEIIDILVRDGDKIKFDQILFKVGQNMKK
ncbi:MAG: hypothetical protein FWE45_01055 [Firmicutes bacterium]|nr:hypothetical protein [Bacillota bacterium]